MTDSTCPKCATKNSALADNQMKETSWVVCDNCDCWFHWPCVSGDTPLKPDSWYCESCRDIPDKQFLSEVSESSADENDTPNSVKANGKRGRKAKNAKVAGTPKTTRASRVTRASGVAAETPVVDATLTSFDEPAAPVTQAAFVTSSVEGAAASAASSVQEETSTATPSLAVAPSTATPSIAPGSPQTSIHSEETRPELQVGKRPLEADDTGPSRKSRRAAKHIDYANFNKHLPAVTDKWTRILEYKKIISDYPFPVMKGTELNDAWLASPDAFQEPTLVPTPEGLGMRMPPNTITVKEIAERVGLDHPLNVMDVASQSGAPAWTLGKFAAYYDDERQQQKKLYNVISLEVSKTSLSDLIEAPAVVRKLDWVPNVWPEEDLDRPTVQKYVLMSVEGCWTDWHIDFSASSVFYHILQGRKTFFFIRPTDKNLAAYQRWSGHIEEQENTWLGDFVDAVYRLDLEPGNTMFIPPGWIHAVHTPAKSLVIGGNFVHSLDIDKHLKVYEIERATKVPRKFRFPFFVKLLWYVANYYATAVNNGLRVQPRILKGLKVLSEFLIRQAITIVRDTKSLDVPAHEKQRLERLRKAARDAFPYEDVTEAMPLARLLRKQALLQLKEPLDNMAKCDVDFLVGDEPDYDKLMAAHRRKSHKARKSTEAPQAQAPQAEGPKPQWSNGNMLPGFYSKDKAVQRKKVYPRKVSRDTILEQIQTPNDLHERDDVRVHPLYPQWGTVACHVENSDQTKMTTRSYYSAMSDLNPKALEEEHPSADTFVMVTLEKKTVRTITEKTVWRVPLTLADRSTFKYQFKDNRKNEDIVLEQGGPILFDREQHRHLLQQSQGNSAGRSEQPSHHVHHGASQQQGPQFTLNQEAKPQSYMNDQQLLSFTQHNNLAESGEPHSSGSALVLPSNTHSVQATPLSQQLNSSASASSLPVFQPRPCPSGSPEQYALMGDNPRTTSFLSRQEGTNLSPAQDPPVSASPVPGIVAPAMREDSDSLICTQVSSPARTLGPSENVSTLLADKQIPDSTGHRNSPPEPRDVAPDS